MHADRDRDTMPHEKEDAEVSAPNIADQPVPPASAEPSSDVCRAEELVDSPNPSAAHLEDDITAVTHEIGTEPTPAIHPPFFHPFSIHVLALLMSSSVFGTLARLGIHSLASYTGQSIFPLAWVQAVGCGIMGFALSLRDPITLLYAIMLDFALSCVD